MKLNLENKKVKYEVWFDYDIKKDTEQGVAVELRKALELPEKYEKRITKAIKMLLREKIVMIEMLLLMNKQNRNLRYQQFRSKNELPVARQKSGWLDESKEVEHANSFNRFLDEKLQIWRCKKREYSFERNHMKLLGRSRSNLSYINKEDINSRILNLNGTANEEYKACEINSNLFNIYEYHNSYTASSQIKHSFHSTFDRISRDHYSKYLEIPSLLIEKALSEYDIKYYSHYEDIVEPQRVDYSFEKPENYVDPNFNQPSPPFNTSGISEIEHQPMITELMRENLLQDIRLLK